MNMRDNVEKIYRKTDGYCHLCHKKICLKNYGKNGSRGAWSIDHSKPKSKGGSDNIRNLFPACISCNSQKGIKSTHSVRKKKGKNRAPYSKPKKNEIKTTNTVLGVVVGSSIGHLLQAGVGSIVGGVVGGIIAIESSPNK